MTRLPYLIIGSGPGALQLGYFLQRSGRDYLILERGSRAGGFFERYPRHRQLLSINKVQTGYREPCRQLRFDWNSLLCDDPALSFTRYSQEYFPPADELTRYMRDFAERYRLRIRYDSPVERVSRDDEGFVVRLAGGDSHLCRHLVLATGLSLPYLPEIPGLEHAEHYAHYSIDPADFLDQRVLVVGKGNSAFETANALGQSARSIHLCSPNPVRLAWQSHYVGHVRAVNNDFIDTYHLKSQNAILDGQIEGIEPVDGELRVNVRFTHARDQRIELAYDRVLLATGFRVDSGIFDESCRPELMLHGKYPRMSERWESVNVPGLFFAGGLMHARDFQKTMSSFVHGFRHNIDALARIFEHEHHGQPLHARRLPLDSRRIAIHASERASMSAEIFLQPGHLCDAYVLDPERGDLRYYRGLPVDYVRDVLLHEGDGFVLTLEYGSFGDAPLSVMRDPRPGAKEAYLHPVIRHVRYGRVVDETSLPDNLESDWGPVARYQIQRSLGLQGCATTLDASESPYVCMFQSCFDGLDRVPGASVC